MKILAISPHPDDETLGCGGTLLRHKSEGHEIHWLIITEAQVPQWTSDYIERKAQEVQAVGKAFGMASIVKLGFPTIRLDTVPQAELIDRMRQVIAAVQPDVVYLVHSGDVHSDHLAVFTAAMSVLKTFYMKALGVKRVLSCETLSSTEAAPPQPHRTFIPNIYVDVSNHIERKIEIMAMYSTEVQDDPFPRGPSAIRALARYRGASIGVDYAEAFMLIREVS
ncbi:MAG: PIG-L family deacetylase [Betaproteobacteria bacterium]|nr:PIG-L family deacetylase [Betaproteobacteria bacterium]